MNWTQQKKALNTVFHISCIVLCAVMTYPLLYMIFGSLKTAQDIFQNPTSLWPKSGFHFVNYSNGWRGFGGYTFSTFFFNSTVITVLAVVGQVFSSSLIAYGFARCRFPGRTAWFAVMIITMMMPQQVLIIPQYILYNTFGWVNTWIPLILPGYFGWPFFVFLIYQFIQGIPLALDESAYIDGCSRYGIYLRIILPLIKPALVTSAIFATYWKWDDFFGPMIYLMETKKYTVSVALKMFTDPTAQSDWGAAYAMACLSLLPVMLIFFIFQKYLVEGIATTGLKG